MSKFIVSIACSVAVAAGASSASAQTLTTLTSFNGTNGAYPFAGLMLSGNTLYGTTNEGGPSNLGTVFSVSVNGGASTSLATFNGTNGQWPRAELTLSGNTLYGTTVLANGGADSGTVFSVPVTGGAPITLATFHYPGGQHPSGGLALSGNILYGTTNDGSPNNLGTVFSLPVNGGTPNTLANFNGTNGAHPIGGLTLSGNTLYGTTYEGGASGYGTVFFVPVTGGVPTTLATFDGANGQGPAGDLILASNWLYGTTGVGGAGGFGTVFSVPVTGGTPTTLATFNGTNGAFPNAKLALSGNILYGTTSGNGLISGTVFSIPVTGGVPTTLAKFNGNNGLRPNGGLIFSGNILYGTTEAGGTFNYGTVFSLALDSDRDGIPDDWEDNGIPYTDTAGVAQRFRLPGASRSHKDLFVEVDAMAGFSISPEAISKLETAFAGAPLSNPDETTGITLHLLQDDVDLDHVPSWQFVSCLPPRFENCWPQDFDTVRISHFGTSDERNNAPLLQAKAKAYRYCIVADQGSTHLGGTGQVLGDNFIVFFHEVSDPERQAAVFMHELGHNLGLRHGGGDDENGKPNYPSIMNYTLLYRYPWNRTFWKLDFSRSGPNSSTPNRLINLDETSLDETIGVGTATGLYSNFQMPFGINVWEGGVPQRRVGWLYLDGRPTDFGDTTGTGIPDGLYTSGVVQDLNYTVRPPSGVWLPSKISPNQPLNAFDDWAAIRLAPAASLGSGAPAPQYPPDELTTEARDWISQNFPTPPGSCYANCDNSAVAPILNVNDFQCFLNKYAGQDVYANCDGSTSLPVLNVNDFQCFLNAFAVGCS